MTHLGKDAIVVGVAASTGSATTLIIVILAVAVYIKRRKKKLQEQDNQEIEATEDPVYAAELREVTTPVLFMRNFTEISVLTDC